MENEISYVGLSQADTAGESLFRVKGEMDLEPKSRTHGELLVTKPPEED
jgi:hypothetical protein